MTDPISDEALAELKTDTYKLPSVKTSRIAALIERLERAEEDMRRMVPDDLYLAMKAERDSWRESASRYESERNEMMMSWTGPKATEALVAERDALRAKLAKAAEALRDCAEDLATEIDGSYGNLHPSQKARFERDMEPVNQARAVLAEIEDRT